MVGQVSVHLRRASRAGGAVQTACVAALTEGIHHQKQRLGQAAHCRLAYLTAAEWFRERGDDENTDWFKAAADWGFRTPVRARAR
jgi:hypothetical protein